ncbi:peptidoglycan-associated lipoprotein Pal [Acidihalobacter ferrooxydans]|uniref:Peptidoglycan-associated lipoprotein n=1 Tax=Acidihalobacter ferrooxydans TaxID=1765967 RepID=A0A1P8UHQ3_9GAMM|nr:peptidoglycan-associated lipoprotein Pal [Acidihalobacter ferrooxydans]APZ43376.1 peptidoglycan-associated lipoprotein [Acidihalobacter ferrooxydans]
MIRIYRVVFAALFASLLAACAPTSQTLQPTTGAAGSSAATSGTGSKANGQGQASALAGQGALAAEAFNSATSPLASRTIYFAFNSSEITAKYLNVVSKNAQYLAAHPALHVKLEGNTDDRGSHAYNMALGERRAQAVAKLLELQGVNPQQLDIISYGEDNPVCTQQDNACWSLNRRVNIVYPLNSQP